MRVFFICVTFKIILYGEFSRVYCKADSQGGLSIRVWGNIPKLFLDLFIIENTKIMDQNAY